MATLKVGLGVFDDETFMALSCKAQATYWLLMVAMTPKGVSKRVFDSLCGEGTGKVLPSLVAAGLIEIDGPMIFNTGRVVQADLSTPRVQAKRQRDQAALAAANTPPAQAPAPSPAPRAPSPIPVPQTQNPPQNQPARQPAPQEADYEDWGEADDFFKQSEPTHGREPAVAAEFDELFAVQEPAPKAPKAKKEKPAEPLVPEWLGSQRWSDWLEHRKEIRKPMTLRAQNLMLAKLDNMKGNGIDVFAAMEKSMVSGWADVFAPSRGFATKADSQKNEAKRNGGLVL